MDLDPQCNLTLYALDEEKTEELWNNHQSIYSVIEPLIRGSGDIDLNINPIKLKSNLWLVPGDIKLSAFEDTLSQAWTEVLAGQEKGFRVTFAIYRYFSYIAKNLDIDLILLDLGPNFGPLNRSVLLSSTHYIIPLIPDLFSLRGLQNIGDIISKWAKLFFKVKNYIEDDNLLELSPRYYPKYGGYIVGQFNIYDKKPTKFFRDWEEKLPDLIKDYILNPLKNLEKQLETIDNKKYSLIEQFILDDHKGGFLGYFRNLHSLMPRSQKQHKAIYLLNKEDDVFGSHKKIVKEIDIQLYEIAIKIVRNFKAFSD